jgi:hypothetical protein
MAIYATYNKISQGRQISLNEMEWMIAEFLERNEKLRNYARNRVDNIKKIASVSMNEADEGVNLAIFNADGPLLAEHGREVVRNTYQVQKLSQSQSLCGRLVYPLIFWNGSGGGGAHPGEPSVKINTLTRKVPSVCAVHR